jgi:hypothetical protein
MHLVDQTIYPLPPQSAPGKLWLRLLQHPITAPQGGPQDMRQ